MRVVLLAVLLAGCASSESEDECSRVRVDCPNEPSLVGECRKVASTCPATARALFLCLSQHQVCDGSGKLDRAASTLRCPEQRAADELCNGRTDAGALDSSGDSFDSGGVDSSSSTEDAAEEAATDAKPGVSMRHVLSLVFVLLCSLLGREAHAGYTHGWTWKQRPSDEVLARCVGDMQRLVMRRPDLLVILEPNAAGQFRFTGKGEHGDEFVFPGAVGVNGMSTDRKPYDEVVTAALLVARDHFPPEVLEIRSEGTWLQWQDGILLYTETFARPPKNPGLREGPGFSPAGRMEMPNSRWSNPRTRIWGMVIALCMSGLLVLFLVPTRQE